MKISTDFKFIIIVITVVACGAIYFYDARETARLDEIAARTTPIDYSQSHTQNAVSEMLPMNGLFAKDAEDDKSPRQN